MRTFLVALDEAIKDCRDAKGANWTGRSPLLGSIAASRPRSWTNADDGPELHSSRNVAHGPLLAPNSSAFCPNLRDPRITPSMIRRTSQHDIVDQTLHYPFIITETKDTNKSSTRFCWVCWPLGPVVLPKHPFECNNQRRAIIDTKSDSCRRQSSYDMSNTCPY